MRSLSFLSLVLSSTSVVVALWPIPSSHKLGKSTLWISENVDISFDIPLKNQPKGSLSYSNSSSNEPPITEEVIGRAIRRTKDTLFLESYVPWRFHPRNADFEPKPGSGKEITSIKLTLKKPDSPNLIHAQDGEIDESYQLRIAEDGTSTIAANSSIGLVRGLTTFTQLFFGHSEVANKSYTPYAPVEIDDAPKFVHRGLNMDLSRSVFGVSDVLRQIDALAYNKMNRLHLHITDSQSWPLEIPAMPELSAKGAYNKKFVYTPDDVAYIQRYGALQGVEVLLEIDMPGHTSSIWFSQPELIASFNKQPNWNTFAAQPPSGTLKLNEPKVQAFIEKLFNDLLPRVAPFTAYFHTGGDEINKNAYLNDETVKSNDTEVIRPFLQKFVDHAHEQVRKAGLIPIVWEEMLLEWKLKLGKDVIVQTWQESGNVNKSVSQGYKTLVGNYFFWYLDCGRGQWINFPNGDASRNFYPYNDYCAPVHNWRVMYTFDPLQDIEKSLQHLVLGGEVHAWAEQIDPVNIDRIVWPRASAAAEILWGGAKDPVTGQNRSQVEAAPRLSDMRERLVAKGVMAEPIQMPYCTMEKGQCDWPTA